MTPCVYVPRHELSQPRASARRMCTQQFREVVSRASRNAAPDEKERVTAFVAAAAADSFLGGSKSRPSGGPGPAAESFLLARAHLLFTDRMLLWKISSIDPSDSRKFSAPASDCD